MSTSGRHMVSIEGRQFVYLTEKESLPVGDRGCVQNGDRGSLPEGDRLLDKGRQEVYLRVTGRLLEGGRKSTSWIFRVSTGGRQVVYQRETESV